MSTVVGGLGQDHGQAHTLSHFERFADDMAQLLQIERLLQVVERALLHGLDCRACRRRSGDEDDRNASVDRSDLLVDGEPRLIGQTQVEEDHIRRCSADVIDSGASRDDRCDVMIWRWKRSAHLLGQELQIIVDEQNVRHAVRHIVLANCVRSLRTFGMRPATSSDRDAIVERHGPSLRPSDARLRSNCSIISEHFPPQSFRDEHVDFG